MKTSSFLTALRANSAFPLVFQAGREIASPSYHLTEVKRVAYETMDCGAMAHRWSESQFEIWVPSSAEQGRDHMPAEKFLKIIDRVETELPLQGDAAVRIHASFNGQPAALYDIEAMTARDGKLWVELRADKTRCKAADRRGANTASACCESGSTESAKQAGGCGCDSTKAETPAVACCA
jgi:hypothetical protein